MSGPGAGALRRLAEEMRAELEGRILPYWLEQGRDRTHGGWVGHVSWDGVRDEHAPKGGIVNARILWTFSAAARLLGGPALRAAADAAAEELLGRFVDPEHGGVFWMIRADGEPLDTRKHVYAQAFAIYALAEHARATGSARSLQAARALFRRVEEHAHDAVNGGYREAFSRDWRPLDDVRLSDVDADVPRSMNTHLHVMEAYATLLRAAPDAAVRARLHALVELILEHVVRAGHVVAFFAEDWTPRSRELSYGHDIETAWLLLDAADALGDAGLRARARAAALEIAGAVLAEGLDAEWGGLFNAGGPGGATDTDKDWWPQAEAVVGFACAYQESGEARYLEAALGVWEFIRRSLVDPVHGEWHWGVTRQGAVRPGREKVGPWKGPYHNGRACLELMARAGLLEERPAGG